MPNLNLALPTSLVSALGSLSAEGRGSISSFVTEAIAAFLEKPRHTLFQVSTARSLVAGKYSGVITFATLLEQGDFGLGTFAGLHGEMVVVDGNVFRVDDRGKISEALPSDKAPFATVTRFEPPLTKAWMAWRLLTIYMLSCTEN